MEELCSKSPAELAEYRLELADLFGKAGELSVKLRRLRAEHYETFRKDHKSDAGWERAWERSKSGLELMELEMKMKCIKMKQSAIRTLLETRIEEGHNQF